MQPLKISQLAEEVGFHSIWFPDHVCMPIASDSEHTANASGERAYSAQHNMLDAQIVMSAVAAVTETIKLGTTCLISPYRHPLSDARQLATIDVLSEGRLIIGVAAGWLAEEYTALGLDISERNQRLEECIEIYKRSWLDATVTFSGDFYSFSNLSMDPKPIQSPRPPIVFGATTPAGARRAARCADGIYPLFLDPQAKADRYLKLQEEVRRELERVDRSSDNFSMICAASARLCADSERSWSQRPICTGNADEILEDLEAFAANGYSMVVLALDCPSGTLSEFEDQILGVGESVIPEARAIEIQGDWSPLD
jgi:probable F420-dependent oxidoreductase